jgi:tRNA threonylcarbamoyladenosine biosynthesis protein TsaE
MAVALNIVTHSPEETMGLAEKLAAALRPGDVLVLTGELGAGKTEFVRGLAGALGHDRDKVNSPSFTIVNEYPGEKPLYHFDLYRIGDIDELHETGWDDYLSRDGLVVVEWGEKAAPLLPPEYYRVTFEIVGENDRKIEIEAVSL